MMNGVLHYLKCLVISIVLLGIISGLAWIMAGVLWFIFGQSFDRVFVCGAVLTLSILLYRIPSKPDAPPK